MDSIEKQKDFFKKVIAIKEIKNDKRQLKLYKELVFSRFFEVISNANPILCSIVDEKRLKKAVKKFIKSGAKTDLIWKVPNEFRKFVKNDKTIFDGLPYINDLLWFEWIDIELFMKNYSSFKKESFDNKSLYILSKSARIKKLSYEVYKKKFDTKGKYSLLAYYDLNKKEVIYREISIFMYHFLKLLSKKNVLDAISKMSKEYKIKTKELEEILIEPLKELCSLGVLAKKD